VLAAWTPAPTGVRQRGGQTQYSDQAITCLLTLRAVFRLPYRQTEGLARSIMPLLDTDVIIPDYTTLGKRSATLPVDLPVQATGEPMHIVIDYIRGLAMPVRSAVPHE
jgi:hypothetical protein